jgi:RNA polymerase sigma factor (sigma-70 family)
MVGVQSGEGLRHLEILFARGALGHLTDAQLLERFARRDEAQAVFEALVVRHGPGVMRVCRRILSDSHDAEDAFQATFLVLARRAGSIRRPESLSSWLHGVALRVARKARVAAARRRYERHATGCASSEHDSGHDLIACLQDEVDGLPESLRAPVVLCYLEEKTYAVAARHLRVSEGTIRGRLARARDLLRARLTRKEGIAPPGMTAGSASRSSRDAVPPTLIGATTRAAMSLALCGPGSVGVSATIADLTEGVLTMMLVSKLKVAAVIVTALGLAVSGAAALTAKEPHEAQAGVAQVGTTASSAPSTAAPKDPPPPDKGKTQSRTADARPPIVMILDAAIERLFRVNDADRALLEIPRSRADHLTAGLRGNPMIHADADLDPYGRYTSPRHVKVAANSRVLFAINIKHDLPSRESLLVRTVPEAQFQDATRNRIGNLYSVFVDVLEAQEKARLASENLAG